MDRRMAESLDRYITGNYGEDQFRLVEVEEKNDVIDKMFIKDAIMGFIEEEPRITLTAIASKTKLPISVVYDYLCQIQKTHKLTGKWQKI